MKKIELTEATKPLAEYVKEMDGMSMLIMFKGVALAALVPMDNADYESVALGTDPEFIALLEKSRKSVREGRVYTTEEMRKFFEEGKDDADQTP
jgi:hypothetical protein